MTSNGLNSSKKWAVVVALAVGKVFSAPAPAPGGSKADYDRALSLPQRIESKWADDHVTAHWLPDGKRLWYSLPKGPKERSFFLVDAETGRKTTAPDKASLGLPDEEPIQTSFLSTEAHASSHTGEPVHVQFFNKLHEGVEIFWIDPEGHWKSYGKLSPGLSFAQNTFVGHVWAFKDHKGDAMAVFEATAEDAIVFIDGRGRPPPKPQSSRVAPDGRNAALIKDGNIYLQDRVAKTTAVVTSDGNAGDAYVRVHWAPDSRHVVCLRATKGTQHKVTIVESSPGDQVEPKLRVLDYLKAGDELPKVRLLLVNAITRKATLIDSTLFPNAFTPVGDLDIRWSPDGSDFFFDYNQRGHQVYRIIGVSAETGEARVVVEEKSKTFIDYTHKTWRHWLDKTGELLWMSERDGWCHLYLYDAKAGLMKNPVTHGAWVVRSVEHVDEARRQVWFMACGLKPGEDPCHQHLCRAGFDGSGFVQLAEGDGNHKVTFSPDRAFIVDRCSRADLPPIVVLRRATDGSQVCELARTEPAALLTAGWTMPERFVGKGRDGKTDIYGILIKPSNFDPARKYPVLEKVYAGPHDAFAPKDFGLLMKEHQLAELGFIVVQADGMGTNHRGKAFHDVCWKNLKDAGFPDRIAWIREAANSRPWMDLSRVGIYGGSAGGQSAVRALLDHHDFYRVAVADCGCHDNRMDKIWWNEQWMGWPVDESYARNSNVVDAAKLEGRLMLAVGELDSNVDPATTMQVVNALEKANKDFELLVMTNTGHGSLETPYGSRRRMDFLVRNLLNVEPRWQP